MLPFVFCFFLLFKKVLLRTITWLYTCMCEALSTVRVSKKVEAVGHSVTPHRRNTPQQEKNLYYR